MPPAEMFVEPVQTATGLSPFSRTMNLLWRMPSLTVRGMTAS